MPTEVAALIKEAHAFWTFASESTKGQRAEQLDDLRFDALKQWPEDVLLQRRGDDAKRIPARPCLTINLLGQPISQIDNAQEQAQFTPTVKPKDGAHSQQDADVGNGLLRHIITQSHAIEAMLWGAKRTNRAGVGYWRIVSRYLDDPDAEGAAVFDQELYVDRILNQFTVYMDPTAKQPNKRDAKKVIVMDMMTEQDYFAEFGKTRLADVGRSAAAGSLEEWTDLGTDFPGWVSTDESGTRTYRVADWIRIEKVTVKTVVEVKRGDKTKFLTFKKGEKVEIPTGWKEGDRHEVKQNKVLWDKINAIEVLKHYEWPGKYLPVIEMIADEKNVDGERICQGMIRPAKDAQRSYNVMRSAQVETIGLAPRAPFTGDMRAVAQYKAMYDRANIDNYSFLPYDSWDSVNGVEIPDPRPKREVSEPAIQAVTMAAQTALSDVRATTMVPEVSLGHTDPRYRAKGSIQALQGQSDLATSGFLMSYRNAVGWTCEVLLDLIPHYYDRPGRVIETLTGEPAKPASVMLGQHFTRNDAGEPQQADPNHPDAQLIDLTKLKGTVEVAVGKAFPTRRAEVEANLIEMMGVSPEIGHALAPLVFKYADWPGAQEAFKITSQLLWPPQLQGDGNNKAPNPMQLMQQNQQMMQQNQTLIGELQKMQQLMSGKVLESQTRIKVAEISAASAGAVAETKANTTLAETIIEQEAEKAGIAAENFRTMIDAKGKVLDHAHAVGLQAHAQAHTHALADTSHQQAKDIQASQPEPSDAG